MNTNIENEAVILALDVASRKTGYAIYRNGKITKSGTWKLKTLTPLKSLYAQINNTIEQYGANRIVVEDIYLDKHEDKVTRSSEGVFRRLAECRGIVELIGEFAKIPIMSIQPTRVKNKFMPFYTPKDRNDKKAKTIEIIQRLGYKLDNDKADDEADAIALLITFVEGFHYPITHPVAKNAK